MFPDGENYFVRSVAAVQDRITDDELASDVEGFIGQESMHGREHRAFNAHLERMGYPTAVVERYTDRGYRIFERISSPRLHLAVTAAVEHYTATLAELVLGDHQAREVFDNETAQRLFVWHSLEESEHKAVAFDTLRHVGGSELMRRVAMTAVHIDFISHTIGMTAMSISLDPDAIRYGRCVASWVSFVPRSPRSAQPNSSPSTTGAGSTPTTGTPPNWSRDGAANSSADRLLIEDHHRPNTRT